MMLGACKCTAKCGLTTCAKHWMGKQFYSKFNEESEACTPLTEILNLLSAGAPAHGVNMRRQNFNNQNSKTL